MSLLQQVILPGARRGNTGSMLTIWRNSYRSCYYSQQSCGSWNSRLPVSPAHRELTVCNCELAQLNVSGIISAPLGGTTTAYSSVVVKDSYVHDFVEMAESDSFVIPHNGSVQTVLIKNSAFYNINSSNIEGDPIFMNHQPRAFTRAKNGN